MKKLAFFFAALAALFVTSCKKDREITEKNDLKIELISTSVDATHYNGAGHPDEGLFKITFRITPTTDVFVHRRSNYGSSVESLSGCAAHFDRDGMPVPAAGTGTGLNMENETVSAGNMYVVRANETREFVLLMSISSPSSGHYRMTLNKFKVYTDDAGTSGREFQVNFSTEYLFF